MAIIDGTIEIPIFYQPDEYKLNGYAGGVNVDGDIEADIPNIGKFKLKFIDDKEQERFEHLLFLQAEENKKPERCND